MLCRLNAISIFVREETFNMNVHYFFILPFLRCYTFLFSYRDSWVRSHAKLGAFGRRRLAIGETIIHWLKDRYWVLVSVLHIDWMEVECSWVLHCTIWDREVICTTAVEILIVVTRWSFVWHATWWSRECVQLGPFWLRWFEFELLLELYFHTVDDFICVFFVVHYDRVYPLKWSLSSFLFSCSNSARLSRLSRCDIIVIKYSISDALLMR